MSLPKTPTSFPNGAPPPITERVIKPENMTAKETEHWFKNRFEKWIEGEDYIGKGAGLPGDLIFIRDEAFIKHRKVKGGESAIQRPSIRDIEFILSHEANDCERQHESLLVLKGTGVGLSTYGGLRAIYTVVTKPGSNTLLTSSSTNTLSSIFMDKIIEPMKYIDSDILERYDEGNRKGQMKVELLNKSKQKCFLKLNTKNFINQSESISSIDARETSEKDDSCYNFAGSGGDYAFVDEFAIHSKKKEVAKALVSRMRDPNTRLMEGLLLLGGALEVNESAIDKKGLSGKDVQDLKELLDPDTLKANSMRVLFLPFWYGYNCNINNGHSDQLAAEHWHSLECEKLDKSHDRSLLRNFLKTNPRTIDDVLDNVQSQRFEQDVQEKIKIQYEETVKADVPLQKCNLVIIDNKYSFAKGDSSYILEHPAAGLDYYLNIDGIQTSEQTQSGNTKESDLSKLAAVVIRMIHQTAHPYMPVYLYKERPPTVEIGCYRIIDAIRFYHQFGGMRGVNFELNNGFGEFFASIMYREGLGNLIVKRKDISSAGYKESSKIGYYRDDLTIQFQYNQANMFLRKYISSIQLLPLLEDMMLAAGVNADALDAWLGIFNTIPDIGVYKQIKKIAVRQPEQVHMRMVGGLMKAIVTKPSVSPLANQFNNPLQRN